MWSTSARHLKPCHPKLRANLNRCIGIAVARYGSSRRAALLSLGVFSPRCAHCGGESHAACRTALEPHAVLSAATRIALMSRRRYQPVVPASDASVERGEPQLVYCLGCKKELPRRNFSTVTLKRGACKRHCESCKRRNAVVTSRRTRVRRAVALPDTGAEVTTGAATNPSVHSTDVTADDDGQVVDPSEALLSPEQECPSVLTLTRGSRSDRPRRGVTSLAGGGARVQRTRSRCTRVCSRFWGRRC